MMKVLKFVAVTILNLLLFTAVLAQSVGAVEIGEAFKINEDGSKSVSEYEYKSVGEFISGMIPNVMVVANLILFFLILFGGFMMITNAGNSQKQAQGASILTSSLIGFIVIFAAYWIMQILSTMLGYDLLGGGGGGGGSPAPYLPVIIKP